MQYNRRNLNIIETHFETFRVGHSSVKDMFGFREKTCDERFFIFPCDLKIALHTRSFLHILCQEVCEVVFVV